MGSCLCGTLTVVMESGTLDGWIYDVLAGLFGDLGKRRDAEKRDCRGLGELVSVDEVNQDVHRWVECERTRPLIVVSTIRLLYAWKVLDNRVPLCFKLAPSLLASARK